MLKRPDAAPQRRWNLTQRISNLRWLPVRHWFDLRDAMRLRVTVRDKADGHRYRFVADSLPAYQRGRHLLHKEPTTIRWLRANLRPTDVFLDIGANVGTFSIFAGKHLSDQGHVYACEPHLPTAVQLLQNIHANGLQERVSVVSIAASGEDAFTPFRYRRWHSGASGSQLAVDGAPALNAPVGVELKCGLRVDTMIAQGAIRTPDLIKIDTDGIETQILSGMRDLLASKRPRSVLAEVPSAHYDDQVALMCELGYGVAEKHVIGTWKRGMNDIACNVIYAPVDPK